MLKDHEALFVLTLLKDILGHEGFSRSLLGVKYIW